VKANEINVFCAPMFRHLEEVWYAFETAGACEISVMAMPNQRNGTDHGLPKTRCAIDQSIVYFSRKLTLKQAKSVAFYVTQGVHFGPVSCEDASPCSAPAAGLARVVVIGCLSPRIV
jgi:hypothetical protein